MSPNDICSTYEWWIIPRRWAAFWLDLLLLGTILLALQSMRTQNLGVAVTAWLIFVTLYFSLLEGTTGRTFGKWVCGLKVVDGNGVAPGIRKAFIRQIARMLEVNPLLFGAIPAGIAVLQSKTRQRFGDQLAQTFVIRNEDLAAFQSTGEVPTDSQSNVPFMIAYPPERSRLNTQQEVQHAQTHLQNRIWGPQAAFVATLFCIGTTAASIASAFVPKSPTKQISYSDAMKTPPPDGYYTITNCTYCLADAEIEWSIYISDTTDENGAINPHAISSVYVPLKQKRKNKGNRSRG